MEKQDLSKIFLIFLVVVIIYACFLLFKPFLMWLLIAAVLTSIFYSWYEWFLRIFRGRKALASLVICILIALIVITPISCLIFYSAVRIIESFPALSEYFSQNHINAIIQSATNSRLFGWLAGSGIDLDIAKDNALAIISRGFEFFLSGAKTVLGQTANFVVSIPVILFSMFFFFMDGKAMLEKLMHWTPLSNKYDKIIFKKFRNVSHSTVISTFVTAAAQGLIGAVGFLIAGLPIFFPAVAMGFLSLIPYLGSAIIWFPAGVYLLFVGNIWQGVFILLWGFLVISNVDNLIRAYLIKGKAHVHPMLLIFAIIGGISLFGFWGVVFGPLIISLAVTILHIYEMEYEKVLEK
ncbi:MAG: AI-2E family transporter [Patescibacteria group bacterium]|nr:AI-2E family transporter [Patescibacteria group bacterium]